MGPGSPNVVGFCSDIQSMFSDNEYFFTLLRRMKSDVEQQPDNAQKAKLLSTLKSISKEAQTLRQEAKQQKRMEEENTHATPEQVAAAAARRQRLDRMMKL